MTYVIKGGRPEPTLEFDVTDASSGLPARITIASGVVALDFERSGLRMVSKAEPERYSIGFFVPGLAPPLPGVEPTIVAELSLAQVGAYFSDFKATRMHGVADVYGKLMPDPARNNQNAVMLMFMCHGAEPMVLRYRVTLYRPRP